MKNEIHSSKNPHEFLGLHSVEEKKVIRLWRPEAEELFLEVFKEKVQAKDYMQSAFSVTMSRCQDIALAAYRKPVPSPAAQLELLHMAKKKKSKTLSYDIVCPVTFACSIRVSW